VEDWFVNDDIDIICYSSVIMQDLQNQGFNVDMILPAEGAYIIPTSVAVMKNCPNPEGAAALMNFMMSKTYQELRYNTFGNIPANKNVELDPNSAISWDKLAQAKVLDTDKTETLNSVLVDRFNSEIAPIKKAF